MTTFNQSKAVGLLLSIITLLGLAFSSLESSSSSFNQIEQGRIGTISENHLIGKTKTEMLRPAFATPTPPPAPITAPTVEDALNLTLTQYNLQVPSGMEFRITETYIQADFAYAVAEAFNQSTDQRVEEELSTVLLSRRISGDNWQAIAPNLVSNEEYNNWVRTFPNNLIDESTKAFLYLSVADSSEISVQNFSGHKLPWTNQKTAQLTKKDNCYFNGSGSTCSGSGHESQLDFDIQGSGVNGDIYASKPGTVVFVKENSNSGSCSLNSWKQANMVVVQHGTNEFSWYVHLTQNSVPVSVGQTVDFGTKIGVEGNTGYSCGTHLHYMVSTGHTSWTDPNNANDAPWATGIEAVDFSEVSWSSLIVGSWYTSQNSGGSGSSCPTVSGEVKLYDLTNCGGDNATANGTGLWNLGSFNDRAESIAIPSGWSARLYLHNDESSPSICLTANDSDLWNNTFSDGTVVANQASLMRVYDNNNCSGGGSSGNWTADYYDTTDRWWDTNNSGNWKCSENINGPTLDKNYGTSAPCSGMNGDTWVGDYSATINFPSGNYVFRVEHDDGLKLWVNGQNKADRSSSGWTWVCPPISLSGNEGLRVLLREDGGDARVNVTWTTDTSVCTPACDTPGIPTLNVPSNGTTTNDKTPFFDWFGGSNSNEYQIQVDNNSNFSSPDIDTIQSTSNYTPGSNLSDGLYYWRVRGHNTSNGCNVYGSWSSAWSVTIDTTPPSVPNLVSPSNGLTTNDNTPYFDWGSSSGAALYQIQVDNNSNFSSPAVDTTRTSSNYTSNTLADGTYYWRVRVRDAVGNWSAWSSVWLITINTGANVALIYDSYIIDDDTSGNSNGNGDGVVNCGEDVELFAILSNQGSDTATGVNATINTTDPYITWLVNTDSSYPDISGGGTASNSNDFDFAVDANTPSGHIIQFNLNITASNGGPWSRSFSVPVTCTPPPSAPTNVQASPTQTSITLNWTDTSNNEGGFKIYRMGIFGFEYWDTVGANVTSYTDTSTVCGATYEYAVTAFNAGGESSMSTVIVNTPLCPAPNQPSNLQITNVTQTSITLSWTDNSNDEQGFEIYQDTGIGYIHLNTVGANITSYTNSELNCGQTYSYIVTAYNALGESPPTNYVTGVTLNCSSSNILINEVDTGSADAVELYNAGNQPVNMTGWHFIAYASGGTIDIDYTFPNGFTLQPGTYVVLHENNGTDTATDLFLGLNISWANSSASGAAALTNGNTGIDFIRFGSSTTSPPAGTGWTGNNPTGHPSGKTLGRDSSSTDTNDGSDWNSQDPTLGAQNSSTGGSSSVYLPIILRNQ